MFKSDFISSTAAASCWICLDDGLDDAGKPQEQIVMVPHGFGISCGEAVEAFAYAKGRRR